MPELGSLLGREMQDIQPAEFDLDTVARRLHRRRRNRRVGNAVAALIIAAGAIGGLVRVFGRIGSNTPTSGPINGRIVFVSPGRSGPDDRLYSMSPDGTQLRSIANVHAEYPNWSPDGSTIAFDDGSTIAIRDWSDATGHIYTVKSDGTGLRQVTGGDGAEFTPSWSPDGKHLAITARGQAGLASGIFVVDVATGAMHAVTANPYRGYLDKEPGYSPDGTQIVFVRDRQLVDAGGSKDLEALFVVNVNGSGLRRLTRWEAGVGTPSWSPDGSTIVFRSGIAGTTSRPGSQIFLIGANGMGLRQVTVGEDVGSFWPSWAPDGSRILFTRWVLPNGRFELFTIRPDGTNPVPVTPALGLSENEADWGTHP